MRCAWVFATSARTQICPLFCVVTVNFWTGSFCAQEKNEKINLKFLETSAKTFAEYNFDTSEINSEEELIEKINNTKFDDNKFYKIILVGKCSFNIDENKILDLINIKNIIRIRNHTQVKYDIEEIAKQISLKGLFAKRILEKIQNTENEQEKNQLISAFEVGMDVLNK